MVFNMNQELVGITGAFGLGIGGAEGHTRWGVTGVTSFMNKTVTSP